MTAAWIAAERADHLARERQVTFLPYADDPRILLVRHGSGRVVTYSLAEIATRHGADHAYRYRTAAQVGRQRGLSGQLLVQLVPGTLGEPDAYQVQDTAQITVVMLGQERAADPPAHQPRLL